MKKPLLISLTALAVLGITTATTLYAQTTTGSSVIARMKAAAAAFTLSADLNPGQTGLTSAPLTGKKTGDVLTAGEYNRLLELISQGSTNGCSSTSGNVYDSGWVDFQGNPVQTLTHNLGTMDTVVFMEMKSDKDYGIAHSVPITLQPNKAHFAYGNFYTKWYNKTENTISVTTANNIETMSDRYVRVVMIKTSALTSGCGGSSSGPAFYKCTNAQSLDANNAPCYGASRNGGAGTNQYRVVSCTDNDGTRSYTMSSILNFGQLVTNKWAVSVNGGTIECDDGTVLVMDIQGVGSSGGGSSSSSVIACKKKNSTYSTSTLTGQPLVKFTASDCGGVLPDASYNGAIGSLNVCNGAIDHTVYSADAVDGPGVSFSFRGGYACTWPDGNGYDISVIYMK